MCPSCSLHAGNAKHVDHLELPKRKLRLAVVRSKTQVAFGRLPCCMNTTCLKRVVMESINQTESKTQKAKARVAGVLIYKVSIPWVRRCRDTEPCDTQESIERYVRAHIFCVLGTVVFPDKSTTSLNSKFLPLLRDFHWILAYSWGQPVWHIYTDRCIVHHDTTAKRRMAH
ncbi:hypothetical protein Ahy_A09g045746 [Arachis hypogaea]|uniref:Aminotransferase-like plant mobile domain-containing protein n=1 Tax=Arachis hypogaea TaxID=3818 RepID=A0A445BN52_ARAHY|nr:hypothetical protein Ahy_A09g045746 [Arachis hypogaea]